MSADVITEVNNLNLIYINKSFYNLCFIMALTFYSTTLGKTLKNFKWQITAIAQIVTTLLNYINFKNAMRNLNNFSNTSFEKLQPNNVLGKRNIVIHLPEKIINIFGFFYAKY